MIKTIIKRDGSKEEFSPAKINGWGEWASKALGAYVDWPSVVMDTVSRCPEECTSRELQEKLIQTCVDNDSWSYNRMAGRLYAALTYKDLYNGELPTVKEVQDRLVAAGLMVPLDFTDEEYAQVEKIINHKRDLNYAYFQLKHIRKKYALRNRVTGAEYESCQFTFMRMAMALAEGEEDKMAEVKAYYDMFSENVLNAPTPNYVNLGTPLKGYASCCVYTVDDDRRSLAIGDHIAYTMTCMSAGIGAHYNTRSIGDPVRGGAINHQGKLPYFRSLVAATRANMQSSRGGASTIYYTVFDPEVNDISRLKNPMSTEDKRIRGADYAATSNKFIARKIARDEEMFTFTSFTAPDLYQAFYSGDEKLFEELYNKYENDPLFVKNYVKPRDIMLTVLNEGYETGRAYLMFADEANRHTPFKDKIYSSNLCVAPETKVLTDKGHVTIKDVAGERVNVWNGEEWSNVEVVKTGENQKLIKVVTSEGFEIDCTPYHKFYVVEGFTNSGKVIEKRAFELETGDKLLKFETPVIQGQEELSFAYENGFYTGDGCEVDGRSRIYLYGTKKNLSNLFNEKQAHTVQDNQDREYFYMEGLQRKFFVPNSDYSINSRLNWFAGLLDSDGCLLLNGKSQSLQVASINSAFLREVQLMLQTLGVQSKIVQAMEGGYRKLPANDGSGELKDFYCQPAERLLIAGTGILKLKQLGLKTHRLEISDHIPQRDARGFVKVSVVVDEGRYDDTYCFNEPKRNMGVFNGILTGNCNEVYLATAPYKSMKDLYSYSEDVEGEIGLCSLAAINVPQIKSDEQYEEATYRALKMIDKVIHLSDYEFPHLELTAKSRLSAGVGITGLAQWMAERKLSYSSPEGKRAMHELAERHYYYLLKASLRLSKELGLAPWMHKTKWPEGWLPLDTYNRNVDGVVDSTLQYDWESLRQEIVENGGIRNTVLVAHMPVESSSKASGSPNSLYPIRDLTLLKTDNGLAVEWAAANGERLAKYYEIAWDVPTKDMIDCYAIFQKFADQGISADLYRKILGDDTVTSKEMIGDYLYMVKMGMKGRYYQNTLTSVGTKLDHPEEVVEDSPVIEEEGYCESCSM